MGKEGTIGKILNELKPEMVGNRRNGGNPGRRTELGAAATREAAAYAYGGLS